MQTRQFRKLCMEKNKQKALTRPTLPTYARLPINRCNLPAVILGSLSFQQHPVSLEIDGVSTLHKQLFDSLDTLDEVKQRAEHFHAYMRSSFLLDHLDEAGFEEGGQGRKRHRADYLRMLRGWMFSPDGKEAAVLKSWVESRFGLLTRNHKGNLGNYDNHTYQDYLHDRCQGLYNTNALEAQFDLLYTWCQYELAQRYPGHTHFTLYRGVNHIAGHDILSRDSKTAYTMLLNNLNSFSGDRERADEFGTHIFKAAVPLSKLLYFPQLMDGILKGEDEYLVIGGVYEVELDLQF